MPETQAQIRAYIELIAPPLDVDALTRGRAGLVRPMNMSNSSSRISAARVAGIVAVIALVGGLGWWLTGPPNDTVPPGEPEPATSTTAPGQTTSAAPTPTTTAPSSESTVPTPPTEPTAQTFGNSVVSMPDSERILVWEAAGPHNDAADRAVTEVWTYDTATDTWQAVSEPVAARLRFAQDFDYSQQGFLGAVGTSPPRLISFAPGAEVNFLDLEIPTPLARPEVATFWSYDSTAGRLLGIAFGTEIVVQTFDARRRVWEERTADAELRGLEPEAVVYDPKVNRTLVFVTDADQGTMVWSYEYESDSWESPVGVGPQPTSDSFAAAYSTTLQQSVVYADGVIWMYDAATTGWEQLTTDPRADGSQATASIAVTDTGLVVVIRDAEGQSDLAIYDLSSSDWLDLP